MKVGLLALQGAVAPHAEALRDLGATPVEVRTPAQLADVDALVVPGGESTTMSKLLDTSGLAEPLAERLAAGLPTFGTCAGMIVLARTVLDGRPDQRSYDGIDITVRRNAFGRQVDSFEADVDIPAVGGEPVRAVFIRAPWVESVGPAVDVLARVSRGDDETIVAVRQGPLLATAFHPELTGDARVHELFVEMVRKQA